MAKFTVYDFVVADRDMVARGAGYSFRSYTDRAGAFGNPGAEVIFNDGNKNAQGRPIGKAFSVNQSHYKLQAREGQKDYDNKSLYEFFKNAPFCLGSPNGDYTDADGRPVSYEDLRDINKNLIKIKTGELKQHKVKIKLMDDELDAQMAFDTGMKRVEAQMSVGQIDEQTLGEIGAMAGEFDTSEKKLRYKLYEFAGKRPIDYFTYLNAGDRGLRALIRKGISDGVLTQKGSLIYWKETLIGSDEDMAVATISKDAAILNALKEKIDFKIEKKIKKK